MANTIKWSISWLLLHLVLQSQGFYKQRTYFSTFLNQSIFPSVFAAAEEQYLNYRDDLVKLDAVLAQIKPKNDTVQVAQVRMSYILGNAKVANYIVSSPEDGILRQLKFFHIQRVFDSDSYLYNRNIEKMIDLSYKVAKEAQVTVAKWDYMDRVCNNFMKDMIIKFNSNTYFENKYQHWKIYEAAIPICDGNNPEVKEALAVQDQLEELVFTMYRAALFLFFDTMVYALDFSKSGQFNGQPAAPAGAQLGPIEQMWYEIVQSGKEIEKGLETIKARSISNPANWNGTYQSLRDIVANRDPEWNMLYVFNRDPDSIKIEEFLTNYRKGQIEDMYNKVVGPGKEFLKKYWNVYKDNLTYFKIESSTDEFNNKYFYGSVAAVYSGTETVDTSYDESKGRDNLLNAGFNNVVLTWLQFKRLNAKIKCHLKQNYWDFLRPEVIKKSQQPLWRVFGGISKTIFEPCIHNDTDLVGTCTKENHEICMPMKYTWNQMEKMDEDEDRAYTFLKPDPIFRPVILPNGTMTCEETETFAVPLSLCRCGFRTDCGKDLGKNLTCVLQVNDNFRKQCKGGIGYPCKTLPFGPGRHHESCITGYCNMRLNSCEKDPKFYPLIYSGQHRADEI